MPLFDKCKRNQNHDTLTINMPPGYDLPFVDPEGEQMEEPDCNTYVYANFLPPGKHQIIIYCPVQKKVFCRDVVVDLSTADTFPEFPGNIAWPTGEEASAAARIIRADVWKKFRVDTKDDHKFAFKWDIKEQFEPDLFMKDKKDIRACKRIFRENFELIQISFIERLSRSFPTYPEIRFEQLLMWFMEAQQ